MTSTVGEVIVAAMACHGADYAFCVPGESYLPVLDAFHDEPAVQPIATHHEEGAGFMAHAWARATGRTGVAMVTRGPGLAHLAVALHAARQDSVPMVALAGQVPTAAVGRESFQELDLVRFGEVVGKAGIEITHADRAHEQIERAFIAIDLTSADLAQVASGLGAAGVRVRSDAEFAAACKEAIASPVPTVVQAMTSPAQISAWAD